MMVHLSEVSGSQKRFITTGLEYGDAEYIWVAHSEITTRATLKTMDVSKHSLIVFHIRHPKLSFFKYCIKFD